MATEINQPEELLQVFDAVPAAAVSVYREPWRDIAEASARLTIGGSGKLRGATLTAEVRAHQQDGLEVTALPGGLWSWIERGIRGHKIRPKGNRPMPIQMAAAPFASGEVNHPGVSKWRGAWTRATTVMEADIDTRQDEVLDLAEAMGGLN